VEIPMGWDIGRSIRLCLVHSSKLNDLSRAGSLIQAGERRKSFRPSRVTRSSDRFRQHPAQSSRG
jgi:hypothetical protein